MSYLSRRTLVSSFAAVSLGTILGAGCTAKRLAKPTDTFRYEFYRNATAKLHYGGLTLLLDPMLSAQGALPSFAGVAPNPTVELPVDGAEIADGVDAVIVSHMHSDHFDQAAADLLDKQLPVLTPRNRSATNPADPTTIVSFKEQLRSHGFVDVREINAQGSGAINLEGITLHQVWGRHGKGQVGELLGGVNGIVFAGRGLPTVYWTGDTILDDSGVVEGILERFRPDIVIAHTGGPILATISPEILLMDAQQGTELIRLANRYNSTVDVIAVHMDALDHCFSTRDDLRQALSSLPKSMRGRIHIPADGDMINIA